MGMETVGQRIKRLREALGLSAAEFARSVDVSQTCVWNWERDNTNPRPVAVAAICKSLRIDRSYLLTGGTSDQSQIAAVAVAASASNTVDPILDGTASQLAVALGIPRDRIKVRFEIVQG